MRSEEHTKSFTQRVLGAVDLAIEFATLGEYGLEPLPVDARRRERPGQPTGWEAPATTRPRGCERALAHRRTSRSRERA